MANQKILEDTTDLTALKTAKDEQLKEFEAAARKACDALKVYTTTKK